MTVCLVLSRSIGQVSFLLEFSYEFGFENVLSHFSLLLHSWKTVKALMVMPIVGFSSPSGLLHDWSWFHPTFSAITIIYFGWR
jgi:hypothetical protein